MMNLDHMLLSGIMQYHHEQFPFDAIYNYCFSTYSIYFSPSRRDWPVRQRVDIAHLDLKCTSKSSHSRVNISKFIFSHGRVFIFVFLDIFAGQSTFSQYTGVYKDEAYMELIDTSIYISLPL